MILDVDVAKTARAIRSSVSDFGLELLDPRAISREDTELAIIGFASAVCAADLARETIDGGKSDFWGAAEMNSASEALDKWARVLGVHRDSGERSVGGLSTISLRGVDVTYGPNGVVEIDGLQTMDEDEAKRRFTVDLSMALAWKDGGPRGGQGRTIDEPQAVDHGSGLEL